MANIAQAMQKAMLDWALGGATPGAPAGRFAGISLAAPTSVSSNEVATGSGCSRQSASFQAAQTPSGSGSASNTSAMTFGPFSSSAVCSGLFLADSVSSGAGTGLFYGNFATARTPLPGDYIIIAVGALTITLT